MTMKLSEVNVNNIKTFKGLYDWVYNLNIDHNDRRILMDLIDVSATIADKTMTNRIFGVENEKV
jgi:hypothetical protein